MIEKPCQTEKKKSTFGHTFKLMQVTCTSSIAVPTHCGMWNKSPQFHWNRDYLSFLCVLVLLCFQGVEASLKCGYLLNEAGYEVQGDRALGGKHGGPERARNSIADLLTDFEICHLKPFNHYNEGKKF